MMQNIEFPRRVINRKSLIVELKSHVSECNLKSELQKKVILSLRNAIVGGRTEIQQRFLKGRLSGIEAANTQSFLVDQIVRTLYEFAVFHVYPMSNPTAGEHLSILATGGYGRQTLAPFSDVDLMFLSPYKLTAHSEQVIEFMLYSLWDLGLKVGHATRSIDDALRLSREDFTIRTNLLESRWLTGDRKLYTEFRKKFLTKLITNTGPEFVKAKLVERDSRHKRMGDSRYVLEPNVKVGKGGLRDLHTLFWIVKYLYRINNINELNPIEVLTKSDIEIFCKSENFLWTVRFHLHYIVDRPEERLTFDVQSVIGERMGYVGEQGIKGVECFMKDYFLTVKDVGNLTRVLCAILEENHKKTRPKSYFPKLTTLTTNKKIKAGFKIDGNRLSFEEDTPFDKEPHRILTLFSEAQQWGYDVHPSALRLVSQNLNIINEEFRSNRHYNNIFINILLGPQPGNVLMRLNETRVLGAFIPEFGNIVAQMQYDMYHIYTVDEHTIRAIGALSDIENNVLAKELPLSTEIIKEVQSRRVLFVAVLLHDIAKGLKGDHSKLGAKISMKLCPRFGFNDWETETVSWLVLNHLRMSETAFKRDINDPKTIEDFARLVQSSERLRLLLVLTVADIRAVGPTVWNSWKAALLRELFGKTQQILTGTVSAAGRFGQIEKIKTELRFRLKNSSQKWRQKEINTHMSLGGDSYWLSFDLDSLYRHANLTRKADLSREKLTIEARNLEDRGVTEIIIYTADHSGLFARIVGGITSAGASVVDAKVVTLSNGMALDAFWVRDFNASVYAEKERLSTLCEKIRRALVGQLTIIKEKGDSGRSNIFDVSHRVLIDNEASNSHTVIEINGSDRPGLLQDVAEGLSEAGAQISSAHISTYGERIVDVFYVKDVFGLKIDSSSKHEFIRKTLLNKLLPGSEQGYSNAIDQ